MAIGIASSVQTIPNPSQPLTDTVGGDEETPIGARAEDSTSMEVPSTPKPLIDLGTLGRPAANPKPLLGTDWDERQGQPPLFGPDGKPKATDIVQGGLNDCALLQGLGLLAGKNPDYLKNHVKEVKGPGGDPEYQVTLYDPAGQPQVVTVDGKEMLKPDGTVAQVGHNGLNDSTALWPAIYEKAYAIAKGQSVDDALNQGGNPAGVWQTITGVRGQDMGEPVPQDPREFAKSVKTPGNVTSILTLGAPALLPTWDAKTLQATLDNGRYVVTVSQTSPNSMHVVDTQSPNKQAWDLPYAHVMGATAVQSLDSEHPDPTTVTDPNKLTVSLLNPWGPAYTSGQNLQDVPYTVLQSLTSDWANEPVPEHEQSG